MGRPSDAEPRLLEAALTLVWEKSVGGVTVEMICRAAGVQPGTFYHFFKSKSELVARALENHWAERMADFESLFDSRLPAVERIRGFHAWAYEKAVHQKRTVGRVLGSPFMAVGSEVGDSDPAIADVVKRVMTAHRRMMETAVRDGIAEGTLDVCDPAKAARLVVMLCLGAMTSARVHNDPNVLRDLSEPVLHILGHCKSGAMKT